jgi:SAM-dependent methyltransferase
MAEPVAGRYDARWGYRTLDAERYERRRYGSAGRRLNLRLLERALSRALDTVPAGGLVLDAPCGTGILTGFLRRKGFRVVGADISPAMLAVARRRGEALGQVRADLEQPPCRTRSVDAVVSSRFMMHLPPETRPRVLRALADLARGPVIATICHPYTYKSFQRAVRRMLGSNVKRSPRLTRRALAAEAASAGLRIERVIPVLPLLSEVWVVVLSTLPRPS